MLKEIFCGDAGLAALLIGAFGGEGAVLVARNVCRARPLGDGWDAVTVPCAVFSDAAREGVSKTPSGRGWDTDAATNALRRRERTAVVLVPAAPLGAAMASQQASQDGLDIDIDVDMPDLAGLPAEPARRDASPEGASAGGLDIDFDGPDLGAPEADAGQTPEQTPGQAPGQASGQAPEASQAQGACAAALRLDGLDGGSISQH